MTETITGDKELERVLYQLGSTSVRKIARVSLGKGLTVVAKGIRAAVPAATTPGRTNKRIKKSIGKRNKKNKRRGFHEAKAGIHVGKKREARPARQAHLLALGTADRYDNGRFTGSIKPDDFVERGLQQTESAALKRMDEAFRQEFDKEVRKLRLRGGT